VRVQFMHSGERRFDLVVGADGLHSGVRRLTGAQDKFERPRGYLVAACEVPGYHPRDEDIYIVYSAPRRMLGRVALHDDPTLCLRNPGTGKVRIRPEHR
jgi:2-polyprenyl-6-methoxyphenol hydroxylase-like FAD-dependent oxidoreductase